ncbi:MAG: ABC transporter substrate-binding protein [Spirochaetaceae bacterium]|nr:ABC transporter substrate-binding protein [Spirochaetaceae bacterium]
MKKFIYLLIPILAIFTLIACNTIDRIIGGGSGSANRIVIYTSMYDNVVVAVQRALKEEFPNYDIEFVTGGTGRLQHRIATERAAGRLGADIIMLAEPAYSLELKQRGMLHSFRSREAANLAFEHDPDGYWYPVRVNNMVLAFNPARNARNAVPNSFHDFANDARVRGAISMRNPNVSGTTLSTLTALRDKYGFEYFDALGRQNVQIEYGDIEALRKLETGEYAVIMILEESILQRKEQARANLEVIYPTDGTVMIPSTIMIVNNRWSANGNARAAETIVDWFLSTEGQNVIVDGWMHSVRRDFFRIPFGSKPTAEIRANSIPVNWENNLRHREQILSRFEERRR